MVTLLQLLTTDLLCSSSKECLVREGFHFRIYFMNQSKNQRLKIPILKLKIFSDDEMSHELNNLRIMIASHLSTLFFSCLII